MSICFRHYPKKKICKDFYLVIDFLKNHGAKGNNKNWHWARWEWLLGHLSLDEATLPSIGLFEDNGELVGIATHDMRSESYILCKSEYNHIKPTLLKYAQTELSHKGSSRIYISENDRELISYAQENGYSMINEKEHVLALDCSKGKLIYELNREFSFTDYSLNKDIMKYCNVIWKGFENTGTPSAFTEADLPQRPHYNPKLALFIVAPNGEYVAHCGMWYDSDTEEAYVEPVVTIPEFRNRGLGKAVVYECINRCIEMGAQKALVISNQQFYHRLGFEECSIHHLWEKNINCSL